MGRPPGLIAAFDVGGTFTDMVVFDPVSMELKTTKLLTTPADPTVAVEEGYARLLDGFAGSTAAVDKVVHATTLATNALIEARGAKTALVSTAGFRDVLEMGYEQRWDSYDLDIEIKPPLVPRDLRIEVDERTGSTGCVMKAVSAESLEDLCRVLESSGAEAVAVCLINSYVNPESERRVGAAVESRLPGVFVSVSSEIVPAIREYERTCTTVANAYVQPLMHEYFIKLRERLRSRGYDKSIYIMISNGGTVDLSTAAKHPVRMVESGPAAGAIAAAAHARACGLDRIMAFDMGGTTAKVCVIDDGAPLTSTELEVARAARFRAGSGIPIRVPSIDLIEIGAGGGSIASVDALGMLSVGPESAGASPGPVCYGRGNDSPTVTDADVVLGYIGAESFLGGTMPLDMAAAEKAIAERVGDRVGVSGLEAAFGIFDMVNDHMASAARIHAVERGIDPRRYSLFAFGGAGPVHAYSVAKKLGVSTVVVPLGAGTLSALGLLVAPVGMDFVRAGAGPVDDSGWSDVEALYRAMEAEAEEALGAAGIEAERIHYARSADMRYAGQGYEVNVPVPGGGDGRSPAAGLLASFEATYRRIYGILNEGIPVEVLNWRLAASSGPIPRIDTVIRHTAARAGDAGPPRVRKAYFPDTGLVDVAVVRQDEMAPGVRIAGPVIVEQDESTVVVDPGGSCEVDDYCRLYIAVGGA